MDPIFWLAIKFLALFCVWLLGKTIIANVPGAPAIVQTIWIILCCLIGIYMLLPLLH